MDLEKRKRLMLQQQEMDRLKKLKEDHAAAGTGTGSGAAAAAAAAVDSVVVPTEEEVDEFFAILRRMKVAVNYFDEKGMGGKQWREALEQPEETLDDGENVHDVGDHGEAGLVNKNDQQVMNEGLDLNAVAPEAAESGGV